MSLHRQTHSTSFLSDTNSNISTHSRSSFSEHSSYSTVQLRHTHHHHSASAPPSFASRIQSDSFTSKSSSLSSSTRVTSDDEKAASTPSPANKTTATLPTEPNKKAKNRPPDSKNHKRNGERSCLDFDWSYRNVYSSGSGRGRKTMGGGSGSIGACVLM